MSLTVDTRSVKNHTELCYEPKNTNGKYLYKEKTSYLAFASPAIGIGEGLAEHIQRKDKK